MPIHKFTGRLLRRLYAVGWGIAAGFMIAPNLVSLVQSAAERQQDLHYGRFGYSVRNASNGSIVEALRAGT